MGVECSHMNAFAAARRDSTHGQPLRGAETELCVSGLAPDISAQG